MDLAWSKGSRGSRAGSRAEQGISRGAGDLAWSKGSRAEQGISRGAGDLAGSTGCLSKGSRAVWREPIFARVEHAGPLRG